MTYSLEDGRANCLYSGNIKLLMFTRLAVHIFPFRGKIGMQTVSTVRCGLARPCLVPSLNPNDAEAQYITFFFVILPFSGS